MQYKCQICHDTGNKEKDIGGHLTCIACEAPAERMLLEAFIESLPAMGEQEQAWHIHQRALAMAPKQEAPEQSAWKVKMMADYAPRAIPGLAPEPFILGNQYRTQGGRLVRFVSIANEGNSYETMADELGHHRYTRRDFGRGTGAAWDDDCVPPLYTAPAHVAAPAAANGALTDEREIFDRMYLSMHGFHTKAELDKEWHRTGAMFYAALASGPDAALIEAARNVVTCFNDPHTSLAYVARWVNELSEEIAALSGAKDIVSMCKCKLCKGEGWVCENHADKPWTSDAGGCKCGAGAPCTCNSNADLPDGFTVLSGAKGN